MNIFKITLIVLLIFIQSIKPFVSYYFLKKGDNYVLILGDAHYKELNEYNKKHIEIIIPIIDKYSQRYPIDCILESRLNKEELKANEKSMCESIKLLFKHLSKNKSVNLITFDPRYGITDIIMDGVDLYRDYINDNKIFKFKDFYRFIANEYKDSSLLEKYSLQDYINYLDNSIKLMNQWLNSHAQNSQNYNLIKTKLYDYIKKVKQAKKLFVNENPRISLVFALVNLFKNFKLYDQNKVLQLREYLKQLLVYDIDYEFANIGFLHQLLNNTNKIKQNLLVVGDAHAPIVANDLMHLNYSFIAGKSLLKNDLAVNEDYDINSLSKLPIIDNDLISVTKAFMTKSTYL
ncbi:MAG: hypothetical protein P4L22_02015 [Candidatus Babeliales bacterium]|nr:hypothetical protein [Candidatus Babeliales bacterium]